MGKPHFSHRLSVGITTGMNDKLEALAISRTRQGKPVGKSDVIREALRLYLDEQPDVRASRRQIARSLEARLNGLDDRLAALTQQIEVLMQYVRSGSTRTDFPTGPGAAAAY